MANKTDRTTKLNKLPFLIFLTSLILIAGWFYWFQLRPARIKSMCLENAMPIKIESLGSIPLSFEQRQRLQTITEALYSNCLHKNGL